LEVAKLLLAYSADMNTKSNSSRTPLHLASSWRHLEVIKNLISDGADVDAKDNEGQTPLHLAALRN